MCSKHITLKSACPIDFNGYTNKIFKFWNITKLARPKSMKNPIIDIGKRGQNRTFSAPWTYRVSQNIGYYITCKLEGIVNFLFNINRLYIVCAPTDLTRCMQYGSCKQCSAQRRPLRRRQAAVRTFCGLKSIVLGGFHCVGPTWAFDSLRIGT